MRNMPFSKISSCIWAVRFEVLGVILLIIATVLTISTHSGLGIVALFGAGVVLCLFNKFCYYVCSVKPSSCPICDRSHHPEKSFQAEKIEEKSPE
jgi:hypothetical protein